MIALAAPQLSSALAARRAGRGDLPCWLVSPGDADVGVFREVVACDPVRVIRGSSVGELEEAWLEARAAWRAGPGVPVAVGWLSYDLGRQFERSLRRPRSTDWPDLEFRFYDALWVKDAATGAAEVWARDEGAGNRLIETLSRGGSTDREAPGTDEDLHPLAAEEPPEAHVAAVHRVLEYLRAGDVYQVNLARRLAARLRRPAMGRDAPATGWSLFARLQSESPAPHAVWLADAAAGACLLGNSPERFLRLAPDGLVETRPIKGTRPRGSSPADDRRALDDLVKSAKDRAEHVMIVDLERNDLGRVCASGSVEVEGLMRVVSLPTVHHLVTTVRGRMRAGVSLEELLRATFPGGSVTGAPKIRAMQIIDELEPASRGPYTGATGWLGAAGDLDLAVAIRTACVRDGRLVLWVGGGIVVESVPEAELQETNAKASAFARLCGQDGKE